MQCRECDSEFQSHRVVCGVKPQFCSDDCRKKYRRSYHRQWSGKNRDRIYNQRKGVINVWNNAFYVRHRERRKQLRREWYRKNADKACAVAKKYSKANPDIIRAIGRKARANRRARLKAAFVENIDPKVVWHQSNGICGICHQSIDPQSEWHVDHKVPLTKGGKHSYSNVQAAHGRCNRRKGNRAA